MKRISSTVILLFFLLLQGIRASQNPEQEQWYIRSIKIVEAHAQNMLDEVMKDYLEFASFRRTRITYRRVDRRFLSGHIIVSI